MKLGFFGGSFNPPTIAHYNLINQALHQYNFDKVYFVPVNNYYPKSNLIEIEKRIEMLNLLCQKEEKIEILDIEKQIDKRLEAIDIFKIIEKQYNNNEIFFFIGEDNYKKMHNWKNYNELQQYNYIIFQRDDSKELEIKQENITYMKNSENLKISSTEIREKIKNNENISNLVTKEIEEYILKNKLYIN